MRTLCNTQKLQPLCISDSGTLTEPGASDGGLCAPPEYFVEPLEARDVVGNGSQPHVAVVLLGDHLAPLCATNLFEGC